MFSRRVSRAVVPGSAVLTQKRFDVDRWYGHAVELDVWNFKHTNTRPKWMRPDELTSDEKASTKKAMPYVDFATSYEALTFDADRLNPHINRKEFGREIHFRLAKQSNLVARAQHLIREGTYAKDQKLEDTMIAMRAIMVSSTYAKDQKLEDTMIARIADEEHINAELNYVKIIRANEMAEDNRLDILPGGSPNSLREKARWNTNMELHPADRKEIMTRLMAWLPEKYHIVYFDDFQTVAANDASSRSEMLKIVESVKKEMSEEAKASGYEKDLEEVIGGLLDDVDPTRDITSDKIKASSNLDELEAWSRRVHEYNGDDRLLQIYERAADLTKNEKHKALLKNLRSWTPKTKSYA